ncbi:hypothetical protein M3Y97_00027800 [Aphelenchoides bicaudatus]|nr:hypothetical protein M3Y97_00027800 [Aphelenchoides bicaudatus]
MVLGFLFGSSEPTVKSVDNVNVPCYIEVNNGIPRGGEVELNGHVLSGPDQAIVFEFKAFDGIPFHLNLRMGYQKEHKIVVNSYDRGRWRHEHREDINVAPGSPITLQVANHSSNWQITINGKTFKFSHRQNAKDIKRLEIRGDLRIDRLTIKNLDNHIQLPQSGNASMPTQNSFPSQPSPPSMPTQNNFPPQPSFNPAPPYSMAPEPMLAGSGPTITSTGNHYQPYPNEPNPSQPTPNHYQPYYSGEQNPVQPGPNSMYPNL